MLLHQAAARQCNIRRRGFGRGPAAGGAAGAPPPAPADALLPPGGWWPPRAQVPARGAAAGAAGAAGAGAVVGPAAAARGRGAGRAPPARRAGGGGGQQLGPLPAGAAVCVRCAPAPPARAAARRRAARLRAQRGRLGQVGPWARLQPAASEWAGQAHLECSCPSCNWGPWFAIPGRPWFRRVGGLPSVGGRAPARHPVGATSRRASAAPARFAEPRNAPHPASPHSTPARCPTGPGPVRRDTLDRCCQAAQRPARTALLLLAWTTTNFTYLTPRRPHQLAAASQQASNRQHQHQHQPVVPATRRNHASMHR